MKNIPLCLLGSALMCVQAPLFAQPFTTDSRVNDILTHSVFQGFAERLLPWDDNRNEPNLRLKQIERLMPYHSHISPQVVTETLNKMLARVEQGYNAFVVKYRAGMGGQIATEDMAQAVEFVRKNAKVLQVDPNGYSVWGASAGARMAAYIGSYGTQAFGTEENSKPSSVIMLYTGHSDYNRQGEQATFVAIGEQDGIASPNTMKRRIEQLNAMGVPTEFHLYKNLGHGFALGTGTTAEGWEKQAVTFWQRQR